MSFWAQSKEQLTWEHSQSRENVNARERHLEPAAEHHG